MDGNDIDMRMFAQRAGANVTFAAGSVVFNKGDPGGSCMYVVQSGVIEMTIGDKVIEVGAERSDRVHVDGRRRAAHLDRPRQGGMRAFTDRPAQVPLHGGRGAELRALHHGRDGAAHPGNGSGDATVPYPHSCHWPQAGKGRGRMMQEPKGAAPPPQGAGYPLVGRRAHEYQVFHDGLHRRIELRHHVARMTHTHHWLCYSSGSVTKITENCADMWPDRRLIELFKIELPIVQAPVAGAMDWELAAEAAEAGALGSLPCAMLNADQVREQMGNSALHEEADQSQLLLPHPAGAQQRA